MRNEHKMSTFLNVLLVLAFLSALWGTFTMRLASGPEGPVGAWIMFLFPCLFITILVMTFAGKGLMSFVPGGRFVQILAALGIVITLGTAYFASLDEHNPVLPVLLNSVPYLLLIGCAALIHRQNFSDPRLATWTAAILLGSAALGGWGLMGVGAFVTVREKAAESSRKYAQHQADEQIYEAQEVNEYRALPADPPLAAVLRFTWGRSATVRAEARERVSRWPELDDALIELLDHNNEWAISYVASIYEKPPAKLAPAWGRMLEYQLSAYNVIQYEQHAANREPELNAFFDGARKIQQAGGDLRPQLRLWYELLRKSKGLEGLASSVKTML
jgi:hypothetical protein